MTTEEQRIFELSSGVNVPQLKSFFSSLLVAAIALLFCLVFVGLIQRAKNGDFSNIVQTASETMFVGVIVGLVLFIVR